MKIFASNRSSKGTMDKRQLVSALESAIYAYEGLSEEATEEVDQIVGQGFYEELLDAVRDLKQ